MPELAEAYAVLFRGALILMGAGMISALVRTVAGPRLADRVMGVNMTGTFTILVIGLLAAAMDEPWLLDVCLIYCMISFLAVVILAKVFITDYIETRREHKAGKGGRGEHA